MQKRVKDQRLNILRKMPPRYHTLPGENYETTKSEAIKWLIAQPEVLEYLWTKVVQSKHIRYQADKRKWVGADYD